MGYILGPWMYDDETEDKERVEMTDTDKIDKILDRVRAKRGIPTKESQARKAAVDALIRKPQKQEIRPGAQALVDGIRGKR